MRISRTLFFLFLLGALTTLLYPADITGKWKGQTGNGPAWTFHSKCDGSKLTGTMLTAEGKELLIKDGKTGCECNSP